MSEQDSDIEFDFFEDLEPRAPTPAQEHPPTQRASHGGGPPRRSARGPTGVTPLLRLAGLIAFAILIIVLLVFWVQSCQGSGKKRSYERYFDRVSAVAKDSSQNGQDLVSALITPGKKAIEIETDIDGLVQRANQVVASAQKLKPPGPLRDEQLELLEALQLRVGGLRGLSEAFRANAGSKDIAGAGIRLSVQAQRLVASDVVWDDLFRTASITELQRQGITGIAPPDSNFVQSPDFGSPRYWVPILERVSGASSGGTSTGPHGTGLVAVKALPSGQELQPTPTENTVTVPGTADLAFEATVEDTGASQEVQVKVTLTIEQQPTPIVKTQTIDLINPGERKTVTFKNLGTVQFVTKTMVKVDVKRVPGETNIGNNSAEYPVIFSLG